MLSSDCLTRSRQLCGQIVGEAVHSALLAAGIGVMGLMILTGFSGEKLVLFLHNFTSRAVAADSVHMASFGQGLVVLWAMLALLTGAVRFLDRRFSERP